MFRTSVAMIRNNALKSNIVHTISHTWPMQTINQRLALLREHHHMNVTDFARHIGVDRSRYARIESGPNKPALDAIEAIAERLPTVSLDWLLTGTGEMLRDGRSLAPMPHPPSDPTVPSVVAEASGPQLVVETDEVKELKRRMRWLEEQVELWQQIALNGGDLSKLGGKQAVSFSLGNDEADKRRAQMRLAA